MLGFTRYTTSTLRSSLYLKVSAYCMGDLAKTSGRVKPPLAVRVQSLPDSTRCQLPVTAASTANRFCEHMLTSTCAVNQTYHPSPWEAHWRANIETFSDGTTRWARGCGHLEGKEAEIEQWLAVAARRGMGSATAWSEDVLSYHEHIDCHGRRWKVPLEPLVGLLRHPRFHCLKMQRSKSRRDCARCRCVGPRGPHVAGCQGVPVAHVA